MMPSIPQASERMVRPRVNRTTIGCLSVVALLSAVERLFNCCSGLGVRCFTISLSELSSFLAHSFAAGSCTAQLTTTLTIVRLPIFV